MRIQVLSFQELIHQVSAVFLFPLILLIIFKTGYDKTKVPYTAKHFFDYL